MKKRRSLLAGLVLALSTAALGGCVVHARASAGTVSVPAQPAPPPAGGGPPGPPAPGVRGRAEAADLAVRGRAEAADLDVRGRSAAAHDADASSSAREREAAD